VKIASVSIKHIANAVRFIARLGIVPRIVSALTKDTGDSMTVLAHRSTQVRWRAGRACAEEGAARRVAARLGGFGTRTVLEIAAGAFGAAELIARAADFSRLATDPVAGFHARLAADVLLGAFLAPFAAHVGAALPPQRTAARPATILVIRATPGVLATVIPIRATFGFAAARFFSIAPPRAARTAGQAPAALPAAAQLARRAAASHRAHAAGRADIAAERPAAMHPAQASLIGAAVSTCGAASRLETIRPPPQRNTPRNLGNRFRRAGSIVPRNTFRHSTVGSKYLASDRPKLPSVTRPAINPIG
jgi:hypothetical protein